MKSKYPIYIISKGRWNSRLTSKALEEMKVPYRIVIEPQEFNNYSQFIDKKKILTLPFSNLGQGSIPARNWVWEHSLSIGAKRHWILDDNIRCFRRMNNNKRIKVLDGSIFRACEDFTDRYMNIALSGMNYTFFAKQGALTKKWSKPFDLNTRIYSIILINNKVNFRWRGRYNEDTDLSLRVLKDGWCTILFYAFIADKQATMTMKGGNSDELYKQDSEFDGRLEMAKSLQKQHPDVCKIAWKWGRWQHQVDYRKFKKNKLIKKENITISKSIDNYGMILKTIDSNKVKF